MLLIALLSSILVAQSVPPEFPSTSFGQCSISAGSTRILTQRFDSDGLQWLAPVAAMVILPSTGRATSKSTQELQPGIQTKGFHFNRPPPAF